MSGWLHQDRQHTKPRNACKIFTGKTSWRKTMRAVAIAGKIIT
jgi:hypothetical protein